MASIWWSGPRLSLPDRRLWKACGRRDQYPWAGRSCRSVCRHSGEAEGELSAWSVTLSEQGWSWLTWSGLPSSLPQIGSSFILKPWSWGHQRESSRWSGRQWTWGLLPWKRKRGWWPSCSSGELYAHPQPSAPLSTKAGRQSTLEYTHGSSLSVERCPSYELDGDTRHRQSFYLGSAVVWA